MGDVSAGLENLSGSSKTAEESTKELEKSLKKLGLDLTEIETGVSRFERATINSFKEIADNSQASGKVIQAAFNKALGEIKSPEGLKQLENELEKLRREGRLTEDELQGLERRLTQLGQDARGAADDVKPLSESLDEVSDAADQLGGDGGSLGAVSSILELMKNPAVAAAGALVAMATAYGSINYEASNVNSTLVALTGSQEKATEAMEYARSVANMLGVGVNETSKIWVNFDSTMKSLGQSAGQSKSLFESLSYAIIQSGGSMDDVNDTVEEFREGLTEGTLSGENLEQILRERLPRAFDEMAKSAGVSNEELGKMLEEGMEIQEMLPLLEKGIKGAFGEATEINGVDAAIGRLKNSIYNLFTDTTTGSMSAFAEAIDWMAKGVDSFNRMIEEGQADVTKWIGQFAAISDYVSGNIKSFDELKAKLKELDDTHISDLKMIADAHENAGKKAKESGDKQAAAAEKAIPGWSAVSKAIKDIVDELNHLENNSGVVGEVLSKIGEKVDLSKPKESVDLLIKSLDTLKTSGNLTATEFNEGLAQALQDIPDEKLEVFIDELNRRMKESGINIQEFENRTALLNEQERRLSESSVLVSQSLAEEAAQKASVSAETAELVEIMGTEKEKIEAKLAAKNDELAASIAHTNALSAERNNMQNLLDQEIAQVGGIDKVSDAKRLEFEARQNIIDAKGLEIAASIKISEGLVDETTKLAALNSNAQAYFRTLQTLIDAEGKRLEGQGRIIDANTRRLESEKRLAEAQGDLETAARKQQEIDRQGIAGAENVLAVEQNRLSSMKNVYQQTLSQALADNQLTETEQQRITTLEQEIDTQEGVVSVAQEGVTIAGAEVDAKEKAAEASEKNAKAKSDEGKVYTLMVDAASASIQQLGKLNKAAGDMALQMTGMAAPTKAVSDEMANMSEEAQRLATHLDQTNAAIAYNKTVVSATTGAYGDVYKKMADAANNAWKAFDEQNLMAEKLIAQYEELAVTGKFSMDQLNAGAVSANHGLTLLEATRFDRLEASIEAANEKLREMKEEADDARQKLEELNEEILREKGLDDEADKLALEIDLNEKLAEIEAALSDAKLQNNQELIQLYEEQKTKLEELYRLKEQNLEADIQQRNNESNNVSGSGSQGKTTGSSGTGSSSTTKGESGNKSGGSGVTNQYNITLSDGKSKANLSASSKSDVDALLDQLARAGLTVSNA